MNRVNEMGRLTKDVELRYAKGTGKAVARFTLAVDGFGKEAQANFIPCVAFGKTAETMAEYLQKGSKIAVDGWLKSGKYDKEDGTTVFTLDVIVSTFDFCEGKRGLDLEKLYELGLITEKQKNSLTLKATKKIGETKFEELPEDMEEMQDDGNMPF